MIIAGAATSFGAVAVARVVLVDARAGAQERVFVQVRANAQTRITARSENGGRLLNDENPALALVYSADIDGRRGDLAVPIEISRRPAPGLQGSSYSAGVDARGQRALRRQLFRHHHRGRDAGVRIAPSRQGLVAVLQNAMGRADRVVVLMVPDRPDAGEQGDEAQGDRSRTEKEKDVHGASLTPFIRRAFSVTTSEEADMAIAATSGLTSPRIATGAATRL